MVVEVVYGYAGTVAVDTQSPEPMGILCQPATLDIGVLNHAFGILALDVLSRPHLLGAYGSDNHSAFVLIVFASLPEY